MIFSVTFEELWVGALFIQGQFLTNLVVQCLYSYSAGQQNPFFTEAKNSAL
jgi:hypothetical protein